MKMIGISPPRFLVRIGAIFLRSETKLVLKSKKVFPGMVLHAGFKFRFLHLNLHYRVYLKIRGSQNKLC